MSQDLGITFKSSISPLKKKRDRKTVIAFWVIALVPAVYFYCQYINGLTHVRHPVKGGQTASATSKARPAAGAAATDAKPAPQKSAQSAPAKTASVGFMDSLMSALVPSAEAITLQPAMPPARLSTKPLLAQQVTTSQAPPPLTVEQKRLKIAQDGFWEVMSMAFQYPDHYGFGPDDNLRAARLGEPIAVYQVVQTDRAHYAGQPVTSLLKPADEWIFPVILGDQIRFMVQVRYVGRKFVLGNGSRGLAMTYDKILKRWPASEGFHPKLVINPSMPFYYFTIPELPEQNITDTTRMLDFNPSLTPAAVILQSWR